MYSAEVEATSAAVMMVAIITFNQRETAVSSAQKWQVCRIYSIKNYGRHGVVGHHVRFTCGRSPVRTWMVVLIFDSRMVQDAPLIVLKQK